MSWFLDPPLWLTVSALIGGAALIYWDIRRNRP